VIDLEAVFTGLILGACLYVAGIITAQHVYRGDIRAAEYRAELAEAELQAIRDGGEPAICHYFTSYDQWRER
jgi:hypothetical protein